MMLKTMQDERCKPHEDEAQRLINEMQKKDSAAIGRQDAEKVSFVLFQSYVF